MSDRAGTVLYSTLWRSLVPIQCVVTRKDPLPIIILLCQSMIIYIERDYHKYIRSQEHMGLILFSILQLTDFSDRSLCSNTDHTVDKNDSICPTTSNSSN